MAKKPLTKGQVVAAIAEATGLTKKQVGCCFTALADVIKKQVGKSGPGVIAVAGLMKVTVQHKPAVKAPPFIKSIGQAWQLAIIHEMMHGGPGRGHHRLHHARFTCIVGPDGRRYSCNWWTPRADRRWRAVV